MYLEYRKGHIESRTTKSIVKGRYGTIRSHLDHWLDFIERDTKLKEGFFQLLLNYQLMNCIFSIGYI